MVDREEGKMIMDKRQRLGHLETVGKTAWMVRGPDD